MLSHRKRVVFDELSTVGIDGCQLKKGRVLKFNLREGRRLNEALKQWMESRQEKVMGNWTRT